MGLFDVKGGTDARPEFQIGSPLFDKIVIQLSDENAEGDSFVIETEGNGPDCYYIQSATLDGKPLDRCRIYRDEVFKGGKLHLVMGQEPNENWGI